MYRGRVTKKKFYDTGRRKETYYPTVILHDKNYPLKIVDIPDLPFFPVNSFYNLSDLQGTQYLSLHSLNLQFRLVSTTVEQ